MRVVGECFFWYRLTRVFPDKFHRAVKRLCVRVWYQVSISNRFRDICIIILSAHRRMDGRKKASHDISPVHSVHLADIITFLVIQLGYDLKIQPRKMKISQWSTTKPLQQVLWMTMFSHNGSYGTTCVFGERIVQQPNYWMNPDQILLNDKKQQVLVISCTCNVHLGWSLLSILPCLVTGRYLSPKNVLVPIIP